MKKILRQIIVLVTLGLVVMGQPLHAQILDPVCEGASDATVCQDNTSQSTSGNALYGPDGILTKAAGIISIVVGIASVIVIIIGGLRYILATGDPSKTGAAKSTILYAIVGLVVAALAQAIIIFVLNRL